MNWKKPLAVVIAAVALGVHPLSAANLATGEWYVRLVLKTDTAAAGKDELVDRYNLLGQLNNTVTGFDSRDLPELGQTWAGTYLSVIFYHPEWDTDKETFNTDFHPIAPNVADAWTFEVRSDDPTRDLSLSWQGNQANFKRMVLVDVQDNTVVPAEINGVKQVYRFRMNSVVRQFTWRLLTKQEYQQYLASGQLPPESAPVARVASSRLAADQSTASLRSAAAPQVSNARPSSGWLPLGWGQGEGAGYRADEVPAGLPADPFAD